MLKVQPTLLQVFSPREMMMVYLPEVKHVLINALIEDERVVSSVSIHPRFLCKTEITTTTCPQAFLVDLLLVKLHECIDCLVSRLNQLVPFNTYLMVDLYSVLQ